jgi:mRNA interferase HigB
MQLINEKAIARFSRKHRDAANWLSNWLKVTREASWQTIQEVKAAFPAVDGGVKVGSGGTVTIFDVSGNKYRLVVSISFETQLVRVWELLTHSEYSKDIWKERY